MKDIKNANGQPKSMQLLFDSGLILVVHYIKWFEMFIVAVNKNTLIVQRFCDDKIHDESVTIFFSYNWKMLVL